MSEIDEWIQLYREQVDVACDAVRVASKLAYALQTGNGKEEAIRMYGALVQELADRVKNLSSHE